MTTEARHKKRCAVRGQENRGDKGGYRGEQPLEHIKKPALHARAKSVLTPTPESRPCPRLRRA